MSRWRRAAKVDDNQKAIVKALREIPGVSVELGHDDFLVGYRGHTLWFECKRPDVVGRKSALKPSQIALLEHWAGHYRVVSTIEEIISELNQIE